MTSRRCMPAASWERMQVFLPGEREHSDQHCVPQCHLPPPSCRVITLPVISAVHRHYLHSSPKPVELLHQASMRPARGGISKQRWSRPPEAHDEGIEMGCRQCTVYCNVGVRSQRACLVNEPVPNHPSGCRKRVLERNQSGKETRWNQKKLPSASRRRKRLMPAVER